MSLDYRRIWSPTVIGASFSTATRTFNADRPNGAAIADVSFRFFDAADQPVTGLNLSTVARSEISWEPSWDYALLGLDVRTRIVPTGVCRMWVFFGGNTTNARKRGQLSLNDLNLTMLRGEYSIDLHNIPVSHFEPRDHTGRMKIIVKHAAGVQHDISIVLKMARSPAANS